MINKAFRNCCGIYLTCKLSQRAELSERVKTKSNFAFHRQFVESKLPS